VRGILVVFVEVRREKLCEMGETLEKFTHVDIPLM